MFRIAERFPDRFSPTSVLEHALGGDIIIWIAVDNGEKKAVLAAEFVEYPTGKKAVRLEGVSGDNAIENMVPFMADIEKWGREHGCKFVEMYARKGWKRLLPDFKEEMVVLSKEIGDE